MYKHILIPTDGSKLSAKGVKAGIRLAKALGARVTALHVIPPYLPVMYAGLDGHVQGESRRNFKTNSERAAELSLAAVEREARAAGVRCSKRFTTDPEPWGGILRTASRPFGVTTIQSGSSSTRPSSASFLSCCSSTAK